MMDIIEVREDLEDFLKLAEEVYKEDPVWCKESKEYLEASIAYARATGSKTRSFLIIDDRPIARASSTATSFGSTS